MTEFLLFAFPYVSRMDRMMMETMALRSRQLKLRRNGQKGQERGIPQLPLLENTNRHPKNSLRSIPCEYRVMIKYQYLVRCL